MPIPQVLNKFLESKEKTLLCVGPVSSNVMEVAIEISQREDFPIALVVSRRQIDAEEFGGGYVNEWHTEAFVRHIRTKPSSNIILERDHGGPWQGNYETGKNLGVEESMQVAKRSFEVDIESGIEILHIDPTIPIGAENLSSDMILSRLFELYGHVMEFSKTNGKSIAIEIGSEEQSGCAPNNEAFDNFLSQVDNFCMKNRFDLPLFAVVQTGTKVLENQNVGLFDSSLASVSKVVSLIQQAAEIASKYNIKVKEHNLDFLSPQSLAMRPQIGIRAANIAPEFGVIESQSLIYLLEAFGEKSDLETFFRVVYESGKWKKWVARDSKATIPEKVLMAGHYCFSDPEIVAIKARLRLKLENKGFVLDEFLKKPIRASMFKYAAAFGFL